MEYFIYNIAKLLRRSGIDVSTQEISDCIHLLKALGTDNMSKYTFYNLINTTMIKTSWGTDYILWLIELYLEPNPEISADRTGILSYGSGKSLGLSTGKKVSFELLIEAVLKNKMNLIYTFIKNLNLTLDLHLENRDEALKLFQIQSEWGETAKNIDQSYHQGNLSEEEYLASQKSLDEWNNFLKDEIEGQLAKNMSQDYLLQEMKKRNPRTASFLDSDDALLLSMTQEIQKIGRKMAIQKGRRWRIASKGSIHLRRTIRQSLKTGAIPLNLIKMQKKPSKPDLWLLCDMSNSVSKFIYFMLLFVFSTQKQYTNIRSFLFVDFLIESTPYFQNQHWSSALRNIQTVKGYNRTGYSHYGNVFRQFSNQFLPMLSKKTTVLILGDARNNGNRLDGSEVLAQTKEVAAALYWLNPLSKDLWEKEDCIMNRYQQNCTGAFSCSNIEELEQFISSI